MEPGEGMAGEGELVTETLGYDRWSTGDCVHPVRSARDSALRR